LLANKDLLQSILDKITEKLVTFANKMLDDGFSPVEEREKEIAKEVKMFYSTEGKNLKVPITHFLTIKTRQKQCISLKIKSNKERVKFLTENGEIIALEIEKFLCYMKGKHLQYFYESDPELFKELKSKLKDALNMSVRDPFSRLVLAYIRKHSSDECLFLMPSEFSTDVFDKF
jgi:hypothetical protein